MKIITMAHPVQALLRYHILRDRKPRILFHNSISANIDTLWTRTLVEFGDFEQDTMVMNGVRMIGQILKNRVELLGLKTILIGLLEEVKII